jgi:hypothetical protein
MRPLDEDAQQAMRLPEGAAHGDAITLSLVRAAIEGKIDAAREVREAIEGKAKQRVGLAVPEQDPLADQLRNLPDEELEREFEAEPLRCGFQKIPQPSEPREDGSGS